MGVGIHPSALTLARGETVGRFVVVGLVGRGGMGEVYSAYDPELDRKVALKLLRARDAGSNEGALRLLREAQATAKLSHPNVIVVYDVGTHGDSVFIAMEFVEGSTVGFWLQSGKRSLREILAVFVAAGRGLAAAHEAGLVHRDFKPENVMITRDGQVRVMDFGLARTLGERGEPQGPTGPEPAWFDPLTRAPSASAPSNGQDLSSTRDLSSATPVASGPSGKYLEAKLTMTGAQVGTPAYMAPEQFVGGATDARTDQFSFCVTLYEALYGERPFAGDDLGTLMGNVMMEAVRPPTAGSRVPTWVRRILLRGLRLTPNERHSSMAALLALVEADPRAKRRRWLAAALVPIAAAALVLGVTRARSRAPRLCGGADARLAAIWELPGTTSPRKEDVRRAFFATGSASAAPVFASTSRLLDAFAVHWRDMYVETCEATHVRGEQSVEVLDLRMACLGERLGRARALTELLVKADASVVENAVSAAGALPSLDLCRDVAGLRTVIRPPDDPATRRRVDELREDVARLSALRDAGQCAAAAAKSEPLLAAARQVGYGPLVADALFAVGILGNSCADPKQSVERLRAAYAAAVAARADHTAAEAAACIPTFAGNRLGDTATAREWAAVARAELGRVGADPVLESWVLDAEASVLLLDEDRNGALSAYRRSLVLKRDKLGPDHPDVFIALLNIGNVLESAHDPDEALDNAEEARQGFARVLGPANAFVAMASNNEGEALNGLRRYPEAAVAFQRALDVWRRAGSDSSLISYGLVGLGRARLGVGRAGEAVPVLEQANRIRTEKAFGGEQRAEVRFALARALWLRKGQGDRPRAFALARDARTCYAASPSTATGLAEVDGWLKTARL